MTPSPLFVFLQLATRFGLEAKVPDATDLGMSRKSVVVRADSVER